MNGYDKAVAYFGTQGSESCQEINDKNMFYVPFKITCCQKDNCNEPTSASIMSCYQGSFVSPPNDDIMSTLQAKERQL